MRYNWLSSTSFLLIIQQNYAQFTFRNMIEAFHVASSFSQSTKGNYIKVHILRHLPSKQLNEL